MKTFTAALCLVLLCGWCRAALPTGDDFDGASEDTTNWASDLVQGHGVLNQINQHLEFRVDGAPTVLDQSVRPWKVSRGPYTSDWEVQVDTLNTVIASTTNQQIGTGISIDGGGASSNEVIAIQFSGGTGAPTPHVGFVGRLGGIDGIFVSALDLPISNGAIRVTFDSTNKVVSLFYDADHSGGYSWTQFGSFGINGSGGTDGNMSWGLTNTSQIVVSVYGFASSAAVSSGEVAMDNFATTGLVAPFVPHDLAVTSIKVPKSVGLSTKKPTVVKKAVVTIQNLGPQAEQITAATITNLVDFELQSLSPASCAPPVPVLVLPKTLPVNLAPKKSLKLNYNITFNCANNPAKGANDFSYTATVHHEAIDGNADTQPGNDICPRDPNDSDKGCGGKNPDRTLGADILTDVIMK